MGFRRRQGRRCREFRKDLRHRYPFLRDYPVIFISALTGRRVTRCLEAIGRVGKNRQQRISTSKLNRLLREAYAIYPPTKDGKKLGCSMRLNMRPAPVFTVFSNLPQLIPDTYKKYMENKLRDSFGFEGTPLRIRLWRKRSETKMSRG